jgi:hypothetical protein
LSRAPYKRHILFGKVVKWLACFGKVFNKASVEIGKSDETFNFFEFYGWCPISDSLYLDQVYGNFARADDQSEVVDMGLLKFALLESEVKIMFFERPKNFVDNLPMFIKSSAPNDNVIQIDCDFAFSNQICEDGIYQCLECGGQVGEPKEHDTRLKKTLVGDEGCLPFITFFDPDIMVASTNIKLGKDLHIP